MQFSQATLESGATAGTLSTVKKEPTPLDQRADKVENVQLTYNHTKATLFLEEGLKPYKGPILEYIKQQDFELVRNLEEALKRRHIGHKVVTIREADIAARGQLDLNQKFIWDSLCYFDSFLCEGTPGEKDSPWELRAGYNRGTKFMAEDYASASVLQQTKAKARLEEIIKLLAELMLPIWPEELDTGFDTELLKPEYMTWGQYNQEKTRIKHIVK